MPSEPRATAVTAARELMKAISSLPARTPLRVTEAEGGLVCLIQVWDAKAVMPTARSEQRAGGRRAECRRDILDVLRKAGRPMTRKELVKALREAKTAHGAGTVAKALAELTGGGELVNPKDKRGYRLAAWGVYCVDSQHLDGGMGRPPPSPRISDDAPVGTPRRPRPPGRPAVSSPGLDRRGFGTRPPWRSGQRPPGSPSGEGSRRDRVSGGRRSDRRPPGTWLDTAPIGTYDFHRLLL